MKPRLLKAGFFWRSNDPADIIVGESSINDVVCIAPTTIPAVDLGRAIPTEVLIKLSNLEFIVAGLFGPDRPSPAGSGYKWNGSTHRYGVYVLSNTLAGTQSIVILSNTPDGMRAAILPRYTTEAWKAVFYGMPSDKVWDICWTLKLIHGSVYTQLTAREEAKDAANHKADALQHGANTNPATGPQNLQGLHKEATVHDRAGRVEGGGSPSGEGQGHEPLAPATAL